MRAPALLLLVGSLTGCSLTAPIHWMRPLEAPEAAEPGWSLIFGRVEAEYKGHSEHVNTVAFRRLGPGAESSYVATDEKLFRGFRRRELRDGYFVVAVPPGVYEMTTVVVGKWGVNDLIGVRPEEGSPPRVIVTRPGIYDLGDLAVRWPDREGWTWTSQVVSRGEVVSQKPPATLEDLPPEPGREAMLREAVAGTPWEGYALTPASTPPPPAGPAERPRREAPPRPPEALSRR